MNRYIVIIIALFFMSGCFVRTYTIEKPRKDLEITGNQGYLAGDPTAKPAEAKSSRLGSKRKIAVFEFELGKRTVKSEAAEEAGDTQASLVSQEMFKDDLKEVSFDEDIEAEITRQEIPVREILTPTPSQESASTKESYSYYTIGKNDTLQKISKKFYGTTRKWKLIYEANPDVIKDPDKVYPGKKIKIPRL